MADGQQGDGKDNAIPPQETTLSSVVAAVVASFAKGRASADLATVRLARQYQKHELLRGVPVPRLRLNKVSVSVPLVVTGIHPGSAFRVASTEHVVDAVWAAVVQTVDGWDGIAEPSGGPLSTRDSKPEDPTSALEDGSDARTYLRGLWTVLRIIRWALRGNAKPAAKRPDGEQSASHEGESAEKAGAGEMELRTRLTVEYDRILGPWQQPTEQDNIDPATDIDIEDQMRAATVRVLRNFIVRRRTARREQKLDGTNELLTRYFDFALGDTQATVRFARDETEAAEMANLLCNALPALMSVAGDTALANCIAKPTTPPDLTIEAPTANVNTSASAATITRINLLMSEHGVEWVSESGDGDEKVWRLLPE